MNMIAIIKSQYFTEFFFILFGISLKVVHLIVHLMVDYFKPRPPRSFMHNVVQESTIKYDFLRKPISRCISIIFFISAFLVANEFACTTVSGEIDYLAVYHTISENWLGHFAKFLICSLSSAFFFVVVIYKDKGAQKMDSDSLLILYFAIVGFFFLCDSNNLFSFYLNIELVCVSTYLLACLKKEMPGYFFDAGVKYFVVKNTLLSIVFLLGIFIMYECLGTVTFSEMPYFLDFSAVAELKAKKKDLLQTKNTLELYENILQHSRRAANATRNTLLQECLACQTEISSLTSEFLSFNNRVSKINEQIKNRGESLIALSVDVSAVMPQYYPGFFSCNAINVKSLSELVTPLFFSDSESNPFREIPLSDRFNTLRLHIISLEVNKHFFLETQEKLITEHIVDGILNYNQLKEKENLLLQLTKNSDELLSAIKQLDSSLSVVSKKYNQTISALELVDANILFLESFSFQLIKFGILFVLFSTFVKLFLATSHLWLSDIFYEKSITLATFFFSVMATLSLFVFLIRFCYSLIPASTSFQFIFLLILFEFAFLLNSKDFIFENNLNWLDFSSSTSKIAAVCKVLYNNHVLCLSIVIPILLIVYFNVIRLTTPKSFSKIRK